MFFIRFWVGAEFSPNWCYSYGPKVNVSFLLYSKQKRHKILFKIVENRASQNLTLATTASVVRASATWERGDWEGGGAVAPQCLSGATSTKKIVKKCKKPTGYFNNKNTVFHKFLMIIIMDGNIKFLKTSQFIISLISFFNYLWFGMVWLIYWSRVDKRHMKFVVSIPLHAAQGSHSEAPMGRGWGNIAQGSHAVASSSVGWPPYELGVWYIPYSFRDVQPHLLASA